MLLCVSASGTFALPQPTWSLHARWLKNGTNMLLEPVIMQVS
jgi:hypothetical protein